MKSDAADGRRNRWRGPHSHQAQPVSLDWTPPGNPLDPTKNHAYDHCTMRVPFATARATLAQRSLHRLSYCWRTMGRMVDLDELVSAYEIAERLGYANPISFHTTRRRSPDFPEPILRTGKNGSFLLWLWPDVLAWAYKTGRTDISLLRK